MPVGSKDLAPEGLRELSDDKLVEELAQAKAELFNLRFQSATGQLDSHSRLRSVRREIARLYTIMRERELGIIEADGAAPAADAAAEDEKGA